MMKLEGFVEAEGVFSFAEPIVGRMLIRQTRADAENLKALLEAQI